MDSDSGSVAFLWTDFVGGFPIERVFYSTFIYIPFQCFGGLWRLNQTTLQEPANSLRWIETSSVKQFGPCKFALTPCLATKENFIIFIFQRSSNKMFSKYDITGILVDFENECSNVLRKNSSEMF